MEDATKPESTVEYRGTGIYTGLVVAGVLVLLMLALAVQNTESVPFEFLVWDLEIPLFALIVLTALFAVAIDEVVGLVWRRRRRQRLSERQELDRLRRTATASGPTAPAAAEPQATESKEPGSKPTERPVPIHPAEEPTPPEM